MESNCQVSDHRFATSIFRQCFMNTMFRWWRFDLSRCFEVQFKRFFSWELNWFLSKHCWHHRYLVLKKKFTWLGVCQNTDIFNVGFDLKLLKKFIESFFDFCQIIFVLGNGEFGLKLLVTFVYCFSAIFNLFSGFSHGLLNDWKLELVLFFGQEFVKFEDVCGIGGNSFRVSLL